MAEAHSGLRSQNGAECRPHSNSSSLSSQAAVRTTLERVLNEMLNKLLTCQSKLELVFNELLNKLLTCLTMQAEQAQQRSVEQIVSVGTEATDAATTTLLDNSEPDVTQHVTQRVQAKAAPEFECSVRRGDTSRARTCPLSRASQTTRQASQRALGGTPTRSSSAWVPR